MIKEEIVVSTGPIGINLEDIFEDDEQFELFNNSDINSRKDFLDKKCNYIHEIALDRINDQIIEEIERLYNNQK